MSPQVYFAVSVLEEVRASLRRQGVAEVIIYNTLVTTAENMFGNQWGAALEALEVV